MGMVVATMPEPRRYTAPEGTAWTLHVLDALPEQLEHATLMTVFIWPAGRSAPYALWSCGATYRPRGTALDTLHFHAPRIGDELKAQFPTSDPDRCLWGLARESACGR